MENNNMLCMEKATRDSCVPIQNSKWCPRVSEATSDSCVPIQNSKCGPRVSEARAHLVLQQVSCQCAAHPGVLFVLNLFK